MMRFILSWAAVIVLAGKSHNLGWFEAQVGRIGAGSLDRQIALVGSAIEWGIT